MRYRVQTPVDVTVLRSGIPDTVPGRSVNLGVGGVGVVLAEELAEGETVGVEIQLPTAAEPLRMRALVRHQEELHCGMEFIGLSAERQAAIRNWTVEAKAEAELVSRRIANDPKKSFYRNQGRKGGPRPPFRKQRLRGWIFLLVSVVVLLCVLWWRWNRGWEDLEAGVKASVSTNTQPQTRVPAELMEKLVIHRVDPEYPAAARPDKLQGVILLDVMVGSDGVVKETRALNGPDILAQAAMDALRWWRFEPYRVDGHPVAVETTVAVEFKP